METKAISTGRWDHKLELSQKVINTLSAATWGKGVNLLKW